MDFAKSPSRHGHDSMFRPQTSKPSGVETHSFPLGKAILQQAHFALRDRPDSDSRAERARNVSLVRRARSVCFHCAFSGDTRHVHCLSQVAAIAPFPRSDTMRAPRGYRPNRNCLMRGRARYNNQWIASHVIYRITKCVGDGNDGEACLDHCAPTHFGT